MLQAIARKYNKNCHKLAAVICRHFLIIGTSGIGKTTLGKGLFTHYNGAYVEQSMVPEFGIPEKVDEGLFEEQVCWECCVAQTKEHLFHEGEYSR